MMHHYDENDDFDNEQRAELQPKQWQLELLRLNPDYCGWGPYQDYMAVRGDGWNSPVTYSSWQEFGPWDLNDLNEVFNFYFEINRDSDGDEYSTAPAYVQLVLWAGHPRKGASRGVAVRLTHEDVPAALTFLREAAQRNAARFAPVVDGPSQAVLDLVAKNA